MASDDEIWAQWGRNLLGQWDALKGLDSSDSNYAIGPTSILQGGLAPDDALRRSPVAARGLEH